MTAALKKVETRRDVAERLLVLNIRNERVFAEIDDLRERLKLVSEADNQGFTEDFGQGRHVSVTKPTAGGKFKGIVPVLDEGAFLDDDKLSPKQREKLIDAGIVAMATKLTEGRRPSVSVQLKPKGC